MENEQLKTLRDEIIAIRMSLQSIANSLRTLSNDFFVMEEIAETLKDIKRTGGGNAL